MGYFHIQCIQISAAVHFNRYIYIYIYISEIAHLPLAQKCTLAYLYIFEEDN